MANQKLKSHGKKLVCIYTIAGFSLFLLLYSAHFTVNAPQAINTSSPGVPVRITIPSINVNAAIEISGITPQGEMEAPNSSIGVGWFKLGPRPGEKGSAVIAGHFDGENGETGVFGNLDKLKTGDKLFIQDDKGTIVSFVVRESRMYDPGYAEEVFSANDATHLNLITCDGIWDGKNKRYSKRLVVFSDIAV